MTRSRVLPMVALTALLLVQVAYCLDKALEEAIAWEANGLEYDRLMLRDLRVRDIIESDCKGIRNRRAAYKLARKLEQEREREIKKLLAGPKEGLTLDNFYDKLREINYAALDKVQPIQKQMVKACEYPDYALVGYTGKNLRDYLKTRVKGNRDKLSVKDYDRSDEEEDFWDQAEVDLASDRQGARAVVVTVRNELEALKNDDEQLEAMAEDYPDADITIQRWGDARRAAIKKVLNTKFSSPKEMRRELHRVHAQQLANLVKFDSRLKSDLSDDSSGDSYKDLIYWMEVYFFERQLAVIRGRKWSEHKEEERSCSDFNNIKYDKAV